MKISPLRQLFVGVVFFILLLVIGLVWSIKSSKELNNNFYLVNQTYRIIENSKDMELDLSRAESNARAYFITKDKRFLSEYNVSKTNVLVGLERMNSLITQNENQRDNIGKLNVLLKERIELFERIMYFSTNIIPANDVILLNGKIKNINQEIVNVERVQMAKRQQTSYEALSRAHTITIFSGIVSILISIMILILIRRDIKRRKHNELDLIQLNENKNKFFSIISHDLRGPVKGIVAMCKALIDSKLPSGISEYLLVMHSSAQTTSNLLDNLLTWSKSQMNKIEFVPLDFNLKEVIQDNVISIVNTAAAKNIDMKYTLLNDYVVHADKKMIETVTRNLLWNALKFTMPGGVIAIDIYPKGKEVIVSIADSGIGIPGPLAKKLFTINSKVVRPGTFNEQGTGLGLILCKDFIEKNGGRIWVESVENKGTTFYYSLNLS
jgi:signal transduction histidine kinase